MITAARPRFIPSGRLAKMRPNFSLETDVLSKMLYRPRKVGPEDLRIRDVQSAIRQLVIHKRKSGQVTCRPGTSLVALANREVSIQSDEAPLQRRISHWGLQSVVSHWMYRRVVSLLKPGKATNSWESHRQIALFSAVVKTLGALLYVQPDPNYASTCTALPHN